MDVLCPIDGSDCSTRALEFAAEFADRYDASLHVLHVTSYQNDETDELLEEAKALLDERGLRGDLDLRFDMVSFRSSDRVGKDILRTVSEEGYDHVIMGHHGTGLIGRALLGSAAETVVEATEVPVTVIP